MKEQTRTSEGTPVKLKVDSKKLIEEVRLEDAPVPSNPISKELAAKIREKYFATKEDAVKHAVKVVKKGRTTSEETQSVHPVMRAEPTGVVVIDKDLVHITMTREEFELLSDRTNQIVIEAALAQERITKDQAEIDLLRMETREILRQMRAA